MFQLIRFLARIFFPTPCIFCGKTPEIVCSDCIKRLKFVKTSECPICRTSQKSNTTCTQCRGKYSIKRLDYLLIYKREIKKMIKQYKYKQRSQIKHSLANILDQWLSTRDISSENTFWTFAPSTKETIKERGFTPMEEVLKVLSQINTQVVYRSIFKKKKSKRQALLSRKKRLANIQGKIALKKNVKIPRRAKNLIILDDLATTCASLNECCKVLKVKYPDLKVRCIVFCRAKKKGAFGPLRSNSILT